MLLTSASLRPRAGALILAITTLSACRDNVTPTSPLAVAVSPLVVTTTVSNTDDAGPGSLRQAILDAVGGEVIHFDPGIAGQTIVLSTGQLSIDKQLTIEGPIPAGLTISGGWSSRVFSIGSNGDVVLRNLSIVNGKDESGGGISSSGKLVVDHALIANNQVVQGGKPSGAGIESRGDLTVVNSTITGNVGFNGGGITALTGNVTIRNSTIVGNSGIQGGGLEVFVPVSIRNSIIAFNIDRSTPTRTPNCDFGQSNTPVFTGTSISDEGSCGPNPNLLVADPKIGPLSDNGGPTKTHALLVGSPAIDLGGLCSEADDQRYVPRTFGASCDVGAYEFNSYATLLITPKNVSVSSTTGGTTVLGTISCSAPGAIALNVSLSQTQKVTGRFTNIIQATGTTTVNCLGTSSWSVTLTPASGKFVNGVATAAAQTGVIPAGFLPASANSQVKVSTVK